MGFNWSTAEKCLRRGQEIHPRVQFDLELIAGTVQHETQCASFVMFQHEQHAAVEIGVSQGRGRNQKSALR